MRYLVTARVKDGQRDALRRAIEDGSLGDGSVAGDEYLRDMAHARELADGRVKWVETCFCATPLQEERPVLGRVLPLRQHQGRARAQQVPRRERHRAVGVLQLRLHERLEGWLQKQGKTFRP